MNIRRFMTLIRSDNFRRRAEILVLAFAIAWSLSEFDPRFAVFRPFITIIAIVITVIVFIVFIIGIVHSLSNARFSTSLGLPFRFRKRRARPDRFPSILDQILLAGGSTRSLE